MQTVTLTIGLPGSGKTTWAMNKLKESNKLPLNGNVLVRCNRDDIRDRYTNGEYSKGNYKFDKAFEKKVTQAQKDAVISALKDNCDVIIDDTNLNPKTVAEIESWVKQANLPAYHIDFKYFTDVPVEECIRRDKQRKAAGQRSVGPNVIIEMWTKNILPKIPKVKFDAKLPNAIVVDLDGTLAVLNGRDPYDASKCHITDTPNLAVLNICDTYRDKGVRIIFMSGRGSQYRWQTARFLDDSCNYRLVGEQVVTCDLFMRNEYDLRADDLVKKDLYDYFVKDKYNVIFCIDDRPKVIRMWKSQGLEVMNVGNGVEF